MDAAQQNLVDTAQASRFSTHSNEYEQPEVLRQLHALVELTSSEPQQVPGLFMWSSFLTHTPTYRLRISCFVFHADCLAFQTASWKHRPAEYEYCA